MIFSELVAFITINPNYHMYKLCTNFEKILNVRKYFAQDLYSKQKRQCAKMCF